MKRTAILAPIALVMLTIGMVLGTGVGPAGAAPTRYEQNAPALSYVGTWGVSSPAAASGGSFRFVNTLGATVTATFKGTSLAWIAKKGPNYGIATVSVDGKAAIEVDLYNSEAAYQRKVWETGTLSSGYHTVRIRWTGTKRSAATNTNIGVDAFDVAGTLVGLTRAEQTDKHLGWRGGWSSSTSASHSGGSAWYANAAGSSVTVEFDGVSLALFGKKGPNYGKANITLDGGTPIMVDLYNSTAVYRRTIYASGLLKPGHHVVTMTWSGHKAAAATDTNVGFDALDVRGALGAAPTSYLAFGSTQAMNHLRVLTVDIGVRHGGSPEEWETVQYAVARFKAMGYTPQIQDVPLPDGKTSHNVIVSKPGSSKLTVVVGGHMDSYGSSPGGNDNGSGTAAVIELARSLKNVSLVPTVTLVLFGHEEPRGDGNADHHHYGSRRYVALMTAEQKANLAAMVSIDMVGYGAKFHIRYRELGPRSLVNMLLTYSGRTGSVATYLKDPSRYGYSDHEPFEAKGYPVAWVEWRDDPMNHTSRDTYAHCSASKIQQAGGLMLGFLAGLRNTDLTNLIAARD